MKQRIINLVTGVLVMAFTLPAFSQEELPEVTVVAVNYKYLKAVGDKESAPVVQKLQHMAATYDVKNSEYYEDEYDNYFISFFIPEGRILAAYDNKGKLIRTAEKFKNVKLPAAVSSSVVNRFPKWRIAKDVYLVTYYDEKESSKRYTILLENGNKRMKVKVNESGEFL